MENNSNSLNKEVVERYCRQIILPEIGPEGQIKILNSKVLVIGAGGLGSPCLMYLAGAGIGEIGVVDGDTVDLSNLHRQIIHSSNNKGVNKSKSAEMLIKSFNPNIKVNTYEEHLSNKNAITICSSYDLLIDCSDNPATRYLASDTAVALDIPLVSGSAVKWEGQLTVYSKDGISKDSNKLPCYRCLFPLPTPTSAVCNCADAGVFGPVPGVIGTLQANEAVKLILGYSDKILSKRMLLYDALEMSFKVFKIRNSREDCAACGKEPKITKENISTYDFDEFVNPKENRRLRRLPIPNKYNIKWNDLLNSDNTKDNILIDVRPAEQYNMYNLKGLGFSSIPYTELANNFDEIEKAGKINQDKTIFVMCRAGNQSTHAVQLLLNKGYENVYNVEEGLHGYIKEVDPNVPYY
jgi:adenylyltransferase/sulfurtransferase